jgi:hypothetical protein
MWSNRIIHKYVVVWGLLAVAGCGLPRPVHPMRLEGFPGAPILGDLFPMRDGMHWTFRVDVDELNQPTKQTLELRLKRGEAGFRVSGVTEAAAEIAMVEDFLEIRYQGRLVSRPLKVRGAVGDTWRGGEKARATVFGYDRVKVMGETRRALVVAIDRMPRRDLYWFADGLGWVRFMVERDGRTVFLAELAAHDPGAAN